MPISQDLIDRCVKDERKAQFQLYKECYGQMMQVCMRYQKNREDAQALLNEAFLKVCDKISTYKPETPFEYWVRRITINTAIDYFRKNKNKNQHFDSQDMSDSFWESKMTTVNLVETEMNADSLRALVNTLPPISQQVFNLCVIDGYEYDEVSKMLSISESTCRWHVHFSRKKLQEMIKTNFKPKQPVYHEPTN